MSPASRSAARPSASHPAPPSPHPPRHSPVHTGTGPRPPRPPSIVLDGPASFLRAASASILRVVDRTAVLERLIPRQPRVFIPVALDQPVFVLARARPRIPPSPRCPRPSVTLPPSTLPSARDSAHRPVPVVRSTPAHAPNTYPLRPEVGPDVPAHLRGRADVLKQVASAFQTAPAKGSSGPRCRFVSQHKVRNRPRRVLRGGQVVGGEVQVSALPRRR